MTKEELISKLKELAKCYDAEYAHLTADSLLLKYIDDLDIDIAYLEVPKWYG